MVGPRGLIAFWPFYWLFHSFYAFENSYLLIGQHSLHTHADWARQIVSDWVVSWQSLLWLCCDSFFWGTLYRPYIEPDLFGPHTRHSQLRLLWECGYIYELYLLRAPYHYWNRCLGLIPRSWQVDPGTITEHSTALVKALPSDILPTLFIKFPHGPPTQRIRFC